MRLPAVLVGDGALGGISTTITAFDVLTMRGYDVVAILVPDGGYGNTDAIRAYAEPRGAPRLALPRIPERRVVRRRRRDVRVAGRGRGVFDAALRRMVRWHDARVASLRAAPAEAKRALWWPFTQHDLVDEANVAVIDSRSGEDFGCTSRTRRGPARGPFSFDSTGPRVGGPRACPRNSIRGSVRAAAAAAGRFGHVMFPENAHAPALDAARGFLSGAAKTWGDRVFYSG